MGVLETRTDASMTDPNAWDLVEDTEPDSLEAADPMVFIHYRELYLEDADTLIFDSALMRRSN
jgi:hypothetical protein